MVQDVGANRLRALSFALVLLVVFSLSELTSALTVSMDQTTRALIGTGVFFGTYILMYVALVAFLRWEDGGDITGLGIQFEKRTTSHLIVGLVAGSFGALLVYFIAMYFGGSVRPAADIDADLIATEVMIAVPVALFEELSYRGYLMPRIESFSSRTVAILLTSIWFAVLHFGWWLPLGTVPWHLILIFNFNLFLGGVVLGVSYYLSGNRLWVPIAFHFAWNMIAFILFPVFPHDPVLMPEVFQIEWGITTVPGFILGLSLVWV
ncbi:MAG: lysostaphin resistance A-like protein, partial [Promethearchaeota archaeon]